MEKRRKLDNKVYDKFQRKNKDIYSSARWQRLRDSCIARDSICLWSYYKDKKIVQGKMVHHIIEVEDNISRAYDISNLIFVSDAAHREIHKLYNNGEKERVQRELLEMIEKSKMGGDL
jgi:5-methylcytosine-specific restriction endonuclease McrA